MGPHSRGSGLEDSSCKNVASRKMTPEWMSRTPPCWARCANGKEASFHRGALGSPLLSTERLCRLGCRGHWAD